MCTTRQRLNLSPPSCRRPPDKWNKEVHYFNRWPLPPQSSFLQCFPPEHNTIARDGDHKVAPSHVLVDGTPDYMFNSVAAPRIKGLVPQAKFVIVLRVRPLSTSRNVFASKPLQWQALGMRRPTADRFEQSNLTTAQTGEGL